MNWAGSIIIFALLAAAGTWLLWLIADADELLRLQQRLIDERAHGDVPHLPEGVKAATESRVAGERHRAAQRPSGTHIQQFTGPQSHFRTEG
jgi:hypothetical protein